MTTWAVLVTCHDRREATLACLDALEAQSGNDVDLVPYVVDAGSSDGTAAAVRAAHPATIVLERGDDLFWNAGMRVAFAHARRDGHDGYLWLNDDTVLDPDAVARLERTARALGPRRAARTMLVGATRDPVTGAVTYSGVVRPSRWRPLRWERVEPREHPVPVETMNGNCALVPAGVAELVGNLDSRFTHGMGDFDYGLRARRRGADIVLVPGTVGTCAANPGVRTSTVAGAWRHLVSVKGLPPREWAAFARRWAGPLWPVFFLSPYVRRLLAVPRSGGGSLAGDDLPPRASR